MPDLLICGASDDLLETDGYVEEEFDAIAGATLVLTGPDGDSLWVHGEFDVDGWVISVSAHNENYPSWPIQFRGRPDYPGDPAVVITVPEGTLVDLDEP